MYWLANVRISFLTIGTEVYSYYEKEEIEYFSQAILDDQYLTLVY